MPVVVVAVAVVAVVVVIVAVVVANALQPALQFENLKRGIEHGKHRIFSFFSTSGQLAGIE
jgi:hypothetical protein